MGGKKQEATKPVTQPTQTVFVTDLAEYLYDYNRAVVLSEHIGEASHNADIILANLPRYTHVADKVNCPPVLVGLIHGLEGDFDFGTHLHNGDSLAHRTVNEPSGRPVEGNPPFLWEESALDALHYDGILHTTDWNLPKMLSYLEHFNGTGSRRHGIKTAYLWSYTNLYFKGKYVSDGVWNPDAISKQCGAVAMLKMLEKKGYHVS